MNTSLYADSHQRLFKAFLKIVDDSDAQLAAILNSSTWEEVRSILTIGGGQGIIEASLLRNAPHANLWYLDPSIEQCDAFRQFMKDEHLFSRVKGISQTTFQNFTTSQSFERIISVFSWFYIGSDEAWLLKLIDLLSPSGTAFLILPNIDSIEHIIYREFSPDKRMGLIGDDLVKALKGQKCNVTKDTYVKWLLPRELYNGEQLSDGSMALAAFAAERPIDTFSKTEVEKISKLLNKSQKSQGVPLSWDLISISKNS